MGSCFWLLFWKQTLSPIGCITIELHAWYLAIERLLILLVQALQPGLGLVGQGGDLARIVLHLLPQRLHLRALRDGLAALVRIRQLAGLLPDHAQQPLQAQSFRSEITT